jgi:RimJ/RimL family protein N-acetyltransferase
VAVVRHLRRVWFRLWGRIAYRRLLLMERRLDEPIPDVGPLIPVTIGLLREDEIEDYTTLVPDADAENVRAQLVDGQWCFTARLDGRLISVRWAATGKMHLEYLDYDLDLSADEACSYGLYTDPAFRGSAVSPTGSVAMLRHLRDAGFRRVVSAILPENHAGLRTVAKTGYRRYGVIGRVKLGPWTWRFLKTRPA